MRSLSYTFVIPTFRQTNLVLQCINSLIKHHGEQEIIVVDDGSTDEITNELKDLLKDFKTVKILTSFWNNGFGHSVNRGIDASTKDIVVLVNNDIIFTQNIIDETTEIFNSNEKIGIVGYQLYYPNGRIQHGGHERMAGQNYVKHTDHAVHPSVAKDSQVSRYVIGVTGGLMAIRKKLTDEIGVFKSGYMLAFEDVEFCLRAWHNLWRIYYTHKTTAIHMEGYTRGTNQKRKQELGYWNQELVSHKQYLVDVQAYSFDAIESKVHEENSGVTLTTKAIKQTAPKRVCFIRAGALGDCIALTGVIEFYKQQNPQDEIYVQTNFDFPFKRNGIVNVSKTKPDQVDMYIDLNLEYEKNPTKPIWEAYANKVFGEGAYDPTRILPFLNEDQNARCNFLSLAKALDLRLGNNFVVIHPSCSWQSRTIKKEVYDEIINYFIAKGLKVVIIGKGSDTEFESKEGLVNLKNKISLADVRELIIASKLFISPDSGMMHVAQTTNTPIVAAFSVALPYTRIFRTEKTEVINPKSSCKFCLSVLPAPVTSLSCKKTDCIDSITSADIIKASEKFLNV